VLHRPIETTALTGQVDFLGQNHMYLGTRNPRSKSCLLSDYTGRNRKSFWASGIETVGDRQRGS
jgi:hypothetical protein